MAQTTRDASFGPFLLVVVSRKSVRIAVIPIVVVDMNKYTKETRKFKKNTY